MFNRSRNAFVLILLIVSVTWLGFSSYDSVWRFVERVYNLATAAKEQVTYSGLVSATPAGKVALGASAQSINFDTQIVLLLGRLIVQGKISPTAPGAALPTKLRITVKRNTSSGKTVSSDNYDFNVQSDGTILTQNLPVTDFEVFNQNDVLQLLVIPVDKPLPAGHLTLSVTHSLGNSGPVGSQPEVLSTSTAPQLVFNYSQFIENRPKGGILGPYNLKTIGKPGFALNGTLSFSGHLTSDDTGVPEPATLVATFTHRNATNGQVLSTQSMTLHVQSNGQILNQSFPFTTINQMGVPESLQFVMKSPNAPLPYSTVSIKLTYTPSM